MTPPHRCARPTRRAAVRPLLAAAALCACTARGTAAQQPTPAAAPVIHWGAAVDVIGDLSTGNPTRADSARVALRAFELSAGATLSPRLSMHATAALLDGGTVRADEAFAEVALRFATVIRGGRVLLPIGDRWEAHRHEQPLVERPLTFQRFVAPEVASGSGLMAEHQAGAARVTLAAVDRFVDPPAGTRTIERANRLFSGLGYVARVELDAGRLFAPLRGVALSAGAATSRVAQPLSASAPQGDIRVNAVLARQSLVTGGASWRGVGDRVELRGEVVAQSNESLASVSSRIPEDVVNGGPYYLGPTGTYLGAHGVASLRLPRALTLLARAESLQDPGLDGRHRTVAGAGLRWAGSRSIPMELRGAWEHRSGAGGGHRLLVEGVVMAGAHRAPRE